MRRVVRLSCRRGSSPIARPAFAERFVGQVLCLEVARVRRFPCISPGGGSSPTARAAVAKGFAERSRGHRAKVSSGFPKRSFGLLFAGGVARRLLALLSPKGSLSPPPASSCEVGWAQREGCPSGRYSLTQASRKPPPLGASTGVVGGPLGLAVSWRAWQESSALRAALRAPKGTFHNRKRAFGHPCERQKVHFAIGNELWGTLASAKRYILQ